MSVPAAVLHFFLPLTDLTQSLILSVHTEIVCCLFPTTDNVALTVLVPVFW